MEPAVIRGFPRHSEEPMRSRLARTAAMRFSRCCCVAAATIMAASLVAGCGASGGGTSTGSYTTAGSLIMTLSGTVIDQNGAVLPGYGVSINGTKPVKTNTAGDFTLNIPTIAITPQNTIQVFDPRNLLAHAETRRIDTADCVQTLTPIVVGPPTPPGP
jgi:hypothetical protein